MGLSTVSVITTICVLFFFHKSADTHVPKRLQYIAFDVIAKFLRMNLKIEQNASEVKPDFGALEKRRKKRASMKSLTVYVDDQITNHNTDARFAENTHQESSFAEIVRSETFMDLYEQLDDITAQLKVMTSRTFEKEEEMKVIAEWQALAKVIDRMLFWMVIVVLVLSVIFMNWYAYG